MRRVFIVLFILFFSIACRTLFPTQQPLPTTTEIAFTATGTKILPSPSATITNTISPTETPTFRTPSPHPTLTSTTSSEIENFEVHTHPDGELYVGDLVSLEVIAPSNANMGESQVSVQVDPPEGEMIGPSGFGPFGIQGRQQATMIWAWDTFQEQAGKHTLSFTIQPDGVTFTKTVNLLPTSDLPADEAGAFWSSATSDCCKVWFITDTASERDLLELLDGADIEAQSAIDQMGDDSSQPITITILPRLLGHGGFAADEIHVSYLDRNYATNTWDMLLHHEIVHVLDRNLGGDLRPSLLVEGLAVYLSGGHYKMEPLLPRAAALLPKYLDWYIPLNTLVSNFYDSQHEIGYLEAGALVAYMVDRWGWDEYSAFYRDIHPQENGGDIAAIETALLEHFNLSFAELEEGFISALQTQVDAASWMQDVRLTVMYYDTLRRYQQMLDPSAYFRTAWLLDTREMRSRDIVADYYRHPSEPANIALETLMIAANDDFTVASYDQAEVNLSAVNAVLDAIQQGNPKPFSGNSLASSYLGIVNALLNAGYQAQHIELQAGIAQALVTSARGEELMQISLSEVGGTWMVLVTDRQSQALP